MAEADAEDRHVADEPLDRLDAVRGHRRVAGTVAEKDTVGASGEDVGSTRRGRHHLDRAVAGEVDGDVALHPEVDRDDPGAAAGIERVDGVAVVHGDLAHQVDPVGSRLGLGCGAELGFADSAERSRHGAGVADDAGEPPGVDAGDAGDALLAQHGVEAALGALVAVAAGEFADHDAPTERAARFEIGGVDAVVADVRCGEGHDLAGVARIGDHLLIAAEHGVEHHLTGGDRCVRPDQFAFEHTAVGKHQGSVAYRHG